jgi:hypothetical protein
MHKKNFPIGFMTLVSLVWFGFSIANIAMLALAQQPLYRFLYCILFLIFI